MINKITQSPSFIMAVLLLVACDSYQSESKNSDSEIDDKIVKNNSISIDKDTIAKKPGNAFEESKEVEFDGYKFKFGYEKYDEDKFGFSNPGLLQVIRNGRVIFSDSFKGEGEVHVKSLGHHELSGDILVFTLNWGTEACDYIQNSRYYIITPKHKVLYLGAYWSMSGGDGYASRYFEPIFPEDATGQINSMLIVEGIKFHEHDQPDLYDTTQIFFDGDKYKIFKPTNNLDKVK